MKLVNGSTIGEAKVIVDILPKGEVSTQRSNTQTSITVHNTGLWEVPAKNFNGAIKQNNGGSGREASWQFTVDDKEIYQHILTEHEAWHTGVGARGNLTSVGIEICMFKDPVRQKKAEDNAIALIKYLQGQIKTIKAVRTHKSWSGKNCPAVILARPNGWEDFLTRIESYGIEPNPPFKVIIPNTALWQVRNLVNEYQTKGLKAYGWAGEDFPKNHLPGENDHYLFIVETTWKVAKPLCEELRKRGYAQAYGEEIK